ncbi:MAG: response regulator [Armatimonadota bacterium]
MMDACAAKRVLVVGDRPDVRDVLGELLSRAGYLVRYASHGTAESAVLASQEEAFPHVAVIDTGRPAEVDISVLEHIRSRACSDLPAIVIIAGMTEEHGAEFERLRVHRVLCKPVPAVELLSAVAAAIG